MAKGGYLGGSITIGPRSGWFSDDDARVERLHAVGKLEGETARLRAQRLAAEKSAKLANANEKRAKADLRQRERAAAQKERLLSVKSGELVSEPVTKSEIKQRQNMERVQVVKKRKKATKPA